MQILDHGLDEGGATTLRIQILISQNQSTAPWDRSLRRNPKGPRMSDVEQAGGRRRQSSAILSRIELVRQTLIAITVPHSEALGPPRP
jgi:ribosomal protein S28E/S33